MRLVAVPTRAPFDGAPAWHAAAVRPDGTEAARCADLHGSERTALACRKMRRFVRQNGGGR